MNIQTKPNEYAKEVELHDDNNHRDPFLPSKNYWYKVC